MKSPRLAGEVQAGAELRGRCVPVVLLTPCLRLLVEEAPVGGGEGTHLPQGGLDILIAQTAMNPINPSIAYMFVGASSIQAKS